MAQTFCRFVRALPTVEGEKDGKSWIRGGLLVSPFDDSSVFIAFTLFGEKRLAWLEGLETGKPIVVRYELRSREFEGRWYTEAQAVSIMRTQNYKPVEDEQS